MALLSYVLTIAASLTIYGCQTIPFPIAAKTTDGHILRGVGMDPGFGLWSFNLTDGPLSCSGSYQPDYLKHTIEFPLVCSDGRKGTATVTFEGISLHGTGHAVWADGSVAELIFGDSKAFQ